MGDKRTGKKKKKIRPAATEETFNPTPQAPEVLPKKTKRPSKD